MDMMAAKGGKDGGEQADNGDTERTACALPTLKLEGMLFAEE